MINKIFVLTQNILKKILKIYHIEGNPKCVNSQLQLGKATLTGRVEPHNFDQIRSPIGQNGVNSPMPSSRSPSEAFRVPLLGIPSIVTILLMLLDGLATNLRSIRGDETKEW
jgi:hypothetical protein